MSDASHKLVAVLDIGKTNLKALAYDADGKIVAERSRPNASLKPTASCPYLHLDTARAWEFLTASLGELAALGPIEAISITTHGASGALVGEDDVVMPPVDYEGDAVDALAAEYDALRPPFEEILSPRLQHGLNLGLQLYFLLRRFPEAATRARAFLTYPQYWTWRLSGVLASEVTSLGAHTDLWRPREGRLSSLVERIRAGHLFPPLRRAWETLGPVSAELPLAKTLGEATRVLAGVHDSNAALVPYLLERTEPFTVVSTGTWVLVMAVGGHGPLDPNADMQGSVNIRGEVVPTAKFMGGREFATIAGDAPPPIGKSDVEAIVSSGVLALPCFSEQGGPFPGRVGRIEGPAPTSREGRAALATLYVALVTAHLVERLEAPGELIVEGGFAKTPAFASVLAALLPDRRVRVPASAAGAAEGAALLAHWGGAAAPPKTHVVAPWLIEGLAEYRAQWSAAVGV